MILAGTNDIAGNSGPMSLETGAQQRRLHPNAAGHAVMAPRAEQAIAEAFR